MGRNTLARQGRLAAQPARENGRPLVVHVLPRSRAHPPASQREIFVELDGTTDGREEEANRFASDVLFPPAAWQMVARSQPKSAAEVQALAKRLGIAPGILVGRL